MKCLTTVFLFFSFVSLSIADDTISIENNKITVKVRSANLSEVSQRLETISGIRFVVGENIKNDLISIEIEKQDIEKGLSRLLKNYSKSLEYNQQGELTTVHVEPKTSQSIKAAKNAPTAETISPSSSASPLQTSPPISSTASMKVDITRSTSPIEPGPSNPLIEENPTEMLVEQPSGKMDMPGEIEKHLPQMEVTETDQATPAPHQQ